MAWFYIILAGILSTILVNPTFWIKCVSQLIYKKKSEDFLKNNPDKNKWNLPDEITKFDKINDWEYKTLIGGIIGECIWFILAAGIVWLNFLIGYAEITFLSMLSQIWLVLLFKALIVLGYRYAECELEENIANFITICVIFVISAGINIATPIYEYNYPQVLTINIIEPEVPTISVDVVKTLETLELTDDCYLDTPVYRNGEVIYVLENSDSYIESPGYVSVKGDKVKFVEYDLKYNPYTCGINNVKSVARKQLPTKVFFDDFSLQKDQNGTIYYACLYGTYQFLRAGKNIEGMIYIDAKTGYITTCSLEEIPSFMTGISQ